MSVDVRFMTVIAIYADENDAVLSKETDSSSHLHCLLTEPAFDSRLLELGKNGGELRKAESDCKSDLRSAAEAFIQSRMGKDWSLGAETLVRSKWSGNVWVPQKPGGKDDGYPAWVIEDADGPIVDTTYWAFDSNGNQVKPDYAIAIVAQHPA